MILLTHLACSECFAANSKAYNSLSPFAYKLSDLEAQPIEMKQGYKNRENLIEWVGVGQFNEGTNDLHGVGIQVDKWGYPHLSHYILEAFRKDTGNMAD